MAEQRYLLRDNKFYPVHSGFLDAVKVSHQDVGFDCHQRYLFYKDWDFETYQIIGPFVRDYSDKSTPPYSLLITGSFYKAKNNIYYEGGFSIC